MLETREQVISALVEVFRHFRRTNFKQSAAEMPIRPSEMMVLHYLAKHHAAGGIPRQSDLSAFMGLSPSTVTPLLNALEERRFITRTHSDTDRRVVFIELTKDGDAFLDHVHGEVTGMLGGMVDFLGLEDSRELIRLMEKSMQYFNTLQKPCREKPEDR